MSQTNTPDVNGPSDVAPRQGSQEGVNITPSNPVRQQGPYNQQLPSPQQQFGPRPLLRKNDSRSSIVTRPAGPVPPFVNQPQQQTGNIRQAPLSSQPRPPVPGPNYNSNPLSNPPLRYPSPQQPPARYGLYEHVPTVPGQDGNFRRAVNTVTENQIRFQRPPQPGTPGIVPGVRTPGLYPQKPLPPQNFPPTSGSVIEQNIRKTSTLDNFDATVSHSAVNEQNGTGKIRNMDLTTNDKQKYEDIRSSSSIGFHPDADKDIDTTSLNGKESSRDDTERPESKTGFLSRDHSSHSSMQKIDEDDDDAVVTPSRTSHHSGSGNLRSGKATPISNSNDNISQKSIDLGNKYPTSEYSEMKKPSPSVAPTTETKYYPPHAYSPKPPNIGSTENIATKSPDVTHQVFESPKQFSREDTLRSQTPNLPRTEQPRNDTLQMKNDKNLTQTQDFARSKIMASPQNEYKSSMGIRRPTSAKSQGDNDSGVDESTQGNERSFNGEQSSPRKTPSKVPNSKLPSGKCKTPVKMLHSPKSPDPSNSVPASAEKKKLPMNKIQVGAAPSPNIKTVKSKIGSLDNASYKPGGGKVKLENRKIDFSKVQPRIAAKNEQYQPGGGDKKIQQQKLQWNAKSKIGSLENATYRPGGGDKKIETVKLDFKDKAKPKVGSKDNIKHMPGGGDVKIETKKLDLNVQSKVGSLDNVKHKPGGGDIKIFDDKEYLRQKSGEQSVLSGSQSSLRSQQSQPEPSEPVSDENLNQER